MSVTVSNQTMSQAQFTEVLSNVVMDEKFFVSYSVNGKKTSGCWNDAREIYWEVTRALAETGFDKLYECRFGKDGKNMTSPFFVEAPEAPKDGYHHFHMRKYVYDQRVWRESADGKKYFLRVNLMHTVLFELLWYYAEHVGAGLEIECQF